MNCKIAYKLNTDIKSEQTINYPKHLLFQLLRKRVK